MFTFGFSGNKTIETGETCTESVVCEPCVEICLQEIKPFFDAVDPDTVVTSCIIGGVNIRHVTVASAVSEAVKIGNGKIKQAEDNHSDLVPCVYEGGLKIWECTMDLANYLENLKLTWKGKSVLDLGCGAGFLGIFAAFHGARVVFQDYNSEVIQTFTGPNVLLNIKNHNEIQLFSGDWHNFLQICREKGLKFDIILTSETIYNTENYEKLHNVISESLKKDGTCYLAAKSVYFGVGGSTQSFINFLNKKGKLLHENCNKTSDGVSRAILKLTLAADDGTTG